VWAIGLRDAQDQWDVRIEHATGLRAAHPTATVGLPVGYALTGGGGLTNWAGSGNLLTASYPLSPTAWEVRAKDHEVSDPAEATAYIIGIRRRQGPVPQSNISSAVSGTDPHPSAMVAVAAGFMLVGGGARVNWTGAGNLLTASFPSGNDWIASSKDHDISDPADISVFAIGIR
jgi:vibriolysin